MQILWQAAALVSEPPGSLVYHLVLLFALGAAAAIAVGRWRAAGPAPRPAEAGRLVLAAGLLFVLRLAGLVLAFLAALGVVNSLLVLPPYERAASTLTILTIVWFLAFPQPQRLADALFSLLALLALLALGISYGLWAQQAAAVSFYNGTLQETAWEAAQIFLLAAGAILLVVRRRSDWLLGLAVIGLLLAGHVIHYGNIIDQTSLSGIERLFEIIALPLLAAAIYRRAHRQPARTSAHAMPLAGEISQPAFMPEVPQPAAAAPPTFDSRAAEAFVALGSAASPAELQPLITTGVAHALAAPLALLLLPEPADPAVFTAASAYDLGQLQHIGRPFSLRLPAGLVTGLGQGGSVIWQSGDEVPELHALMVVAELPSPSPIVLTSIQNAGGELLALLATVPPSAAAEWAVERRTWLASLAETIALVWQGLAAPTEPMAAVEPKAAVETQTHFEVERDAALHEVARLQRSAQLQDEQIQRLERAEAVRADELGELESLRASLLALQPEIEASRQRQQQLEADLAQQQAQVAQLNAALETRAPEATEPATLLAAPSADVDGLRATLDMLQPELDYYRQQEQLLNGEVERLRGQLVEQAALLASAPVAEADALRASLKGLSVEVETVRAEHAQQETEAARLRTELEASQAEHVRLQAELEAARAVPSQPPAEPDQEVELEPLRVEILSLQTQLAASEQRAFELGLAAVTVSSSLAAVPPPDPVPPAAPLGAFMDADQSLSEMLEALAGAEARLTRQTAELASLREALAESERRRLAPPPAARPVQAADMEVIASLSQELRQPMSSIIGYVDLLLGESVGIIGALQRKFLERIKASSERIGVLLDDMMRVMDIDSGNLNLAHESVNVVQVMEDALRSCQTVLLEKGLRIVPDVAPNLPPVQADRDALLQIFSHLLNNSAAASANDTAIHLTVKHETEQRPGADSLNYLVLAVTDTGGGIAPEDQPRAFSRLYRADAPLIAGLGDNGMGLSIVKALVEGHGGRIWVISDPGQGSTFYVLLPLEGKYAKANGARAER